VATCAKLDNWDRTLAPGFNDAVAAVANAAQAPVADVLKHIESQKALSALIEDHNFTADLKSDVDTPYDIARQRVQSGPHTTDWLTVAPTCLANTFSAAHYRTLVRHWIGAPVYSAPSACAKCGKANDVYGIHALTCASGAERWNRHNGIANVVVDFLKSSYMNPQREKGFDNKRQWDVLIPSAAWRPGVAVGLDFAVTYPLQQSSNAIAMDRVPGSWAEQYAENHKDTARAPSLAQGVMFRPIRYVADLEAKDVRTAVCLGGHAWPY